ncbi:MAG TPA: DUF3536 domain-containing protein [Candidatus Gastranaerophilales bacterium]|nr:DUF3536 domain-containing protein [Candidatus Gastranaerophilales bacterium]
MTEKNKKNYLTIHGHFYQPPRENPWLEAIELQDSAAPFHDWNLRITQECYKPNSVSRIVNHKNQILDIVNNYGLISFNLGPTLLSWLQVYVPKTYDRILQADKESLERFSGHGNALAQVYNHMIMPLANEKDKYTQTIWGIKDFYLRFGRKPEGIWLAETAVDDDTLRVLVDCGIKFTVLSPYQAEKIRKISLNRESGAWQDVSWGNVDPGKSYRYFLDDGTERYIDLFFYDGSISKSVAFEELLRNGDKFVGRLKDGISNTRDYDQLVNIATDGESYGHHTMLGNMALSYALKKKIKETDFILTNYGEFLENHLPVYEAKVKAPSSWSCSHGVGRWKENCGCSTGAQLGWNQEWRKPLRAALDWLRDQLSYVYEKGISKYVKDPWGARDRYIDVILDRNETTIKKFCDQEACRELSPAEMVNVIKYLEMQRHAMLMYTSCGWFFAEITGIETIQILKYAARAMQIAEEFQEIDLETKFLSLLAEAWSNIKKFGNGKDIYLKFVKPSIVSAKQVVSHWAISSLFEDYEEETNVYCYKIKALDYSKTQKANTHLVIGRIEVISTITFERHDMIFALLHYGGEDFHCVIRGFAGKSEYNKIKENLINKYETLPLTEIIRGLDEYFGKDYFTLKDLFIEERRKIINVLIQDKLEKFASTYRNLYDEAKGPMLQLKELGLKIPEEFKIAAEYSLSSLLNDLMEEKEDIGSPELLGKAIEINKEARKLEIKLDNQKVSELYSDYICKKVKKLSQNGKVSEYESLTDSLKLIEKLDLQPDLFSAQNYFFSTIYKKIPDLIEKLKDSKHKEKDHKYISAMLTLAESLNFNIDNFKASLNETWALTL